MLKEFNNENAQPSADRYINKIPSLGSSSHIVAKTYHRNEKSSAYGFKTIDKSVKVNENSETVQFKRIPTLSVNKPHSLL